MRINKFVAQATGMSRRAADAAITEGRVRRNDSLANPGDSVMASDSVTLDGITLSASDQQVTILLNKPVGYVCSRDGQGNRTVYDLLPKKLHHLKPVGRLDKDTSGLLLLTTDGDLAQELTHPRYQKAKTYIIELDRPLTRDELTLIKGKGVDIGDPRTSSFALKPIRKNYYEATLTEGRNRQIRRTFEAIDCRVLELHRTTFGSYTLGDLQNGKFMSPA